VTKNPEKIFPSFGTIDMNRGYRISPEAGDISHIFADDESESRLTSMRGNIHCNYLPVARKYKKKRAR